MPILTEKEAARLLRCSVYKLQKDRVKGGFIPFFKIGRNVRYYQSDVEAYMASRRYTSTSEYKGGAK